jgi:hypothetical protein
MKEHGMKKKSERSFANMPSEVEFKAYPKYPGSDEDNLDDTMTGIDANASKAYGKKKKYVSNQK